METALPPGPGAPPWAQFLRWLHDPTGFLDSCHDRYGPWFTVRFPPRHTIVFTSDPASVKEVFAADADHARLSDGNFYFLPLLGRNSLFTLDGAAHKRHRRLLMPPFHGERMHAYGETMAAIAGRWLDRLPREKTFRLHAAVQDLTLDIFLRAVFGFGEGSAPRDLIKELLDLTGSPLGLLFVRRSGRILLQDLQERLGRLSPWGRALRLMRELDRVLLAEVARRRREPGGEDVLSLVAQARGEDGAPLGDQEVRDEMMSLLVAGHETTAVALSWVFRRLSNHPEVRARLRGEIAARFPDGRIDPRALAELPLLDAAVMETLRLDPVVPFVWRTLGRPMRLGERLVPAGVSVAPSTYLAGRRADLWPEPEAFKPERFLERKPAPWEHFPFGGGSRRCVGMSFALYEMKFVVAQSLGRVSIDLARPERPRMRPRIVTLIPEGGLPAVATPA